MADLHTGETLFTIEDISLAQSIGKIENNLVELAPPVPTGFKQLDKVLGGGIYPGLTILAGEPGAGKSMFALNIASNVAAGGEERTPRDVLFFSGEMDTTECVLRLLSIYYESFEWSRAWDELKGVAESIKMADAKGQDREPVLSLCRNSNIVLKALHEWPLAKRLAVLESTSSADVAASIGFVDAGERQKAREKFISPLYIVDYIQTLDVDAYDTDVTEYVRVSAASGALRNETKELGVPLISISAMNRDSAKNRTPTMQGLRGSSALEYDAKAVIFLQKDSEIRNKVNLHVLKNRYGATTTEPIAYTYDGAHGKFSEMN